MVPEGPGNSQIQVQDVSGSLSLAANNGTATLQILWQLLVLVPASGDFVPTGSVTYQLDEQQTSGSEAWCQEANDAIYTNAIQALTSSGAGQSGVNYFPDVDTPGPVSGSISGTKNIPQWIQVQNDTMWQSSTYITISTTNDSVWRSYTGMPSSGLFGGSGTTTLVSFNQSNGGFGQNKLNITYTLGG
jgi:hypothetical protein